MPHSIWRGNLSFGLVSIPVSIIPAESRRELAFHLLDRRDLSLVHNRRVNERTGEEVPWDRVVKGYEYEEGRWVVLSEDDFRSANVEATQTIDILGAVCASDIPVEFFDKPYFLEPMRAGRKAYALLRATLDSADRVALARVVIRTRQHLAAVVPRGRMLLLEMLRYPYELRSPEDLDIPSEDLPAEGVTDAELKMATQLVEAMRADWTPEDYRDTYRDDLLELIERRARGGAPAQTTPVPEFEPGAEIVDIMALLKESVERAREPTGPGATSTGRRRDGGRSK